MILHPGTLCYVPNIVLNFPLDGVVFWTLNVSSFLSHYASISEDVGPRKK